MQKNVGDYSVNISSFDNNNYVFTAVNNTLTITTAPLSASWSDLTHVYSGYSQNAKLTISGFKNGDEENYNNGNLSEIFNILTDCDSFLIEPIQNAGTLTIDFIGINADSYDISLTDVAGDNYSIIPMSNVLSITPKKLTGSWQNTPLTYNGETQFASITFQGIFPEDLNEMSADDFNCTYDTLSYDIATKGSTSLTLGFYAKMQAAIPLILIHLI